MTTGQRKYGPPPDWTDPKPTAGCEVYNCIEYSKVRFFKFESNHN